MFKTSLLASILAAAATSSLDKETLNTYVLENKLVGDSASLKEYSESSDGKFTMIYTNGPSNFYKIIMKEGADGKPVLSFREEFSSSFQTFSSSGLSLQKEVTPFDQLSLDFINNFMAPQPQMIGRIQGKGCKKMDKNQMRHGRRELNKAKIQDLLIQQVPKLEGGSITEIERLGFQKGKGMSMVIHFKNQDVRHKIVAHYRPRRNQLNIEQIVNLDEKKSPMNLGLNLIDKISGFIQQKKEIVQKKEEEIVVKNVLSSILDKFAGIRREPLLLGSEGENFRRQPLLLGRQGEGIRRQPLLLGRQGEGIREPLLLGTEGEGIQHPMLGSQGEVERSFLLGSEGQMDNIFRAILDKTMMEIDEEEDEEESEIDHPLVGSEGEPEMKVFEEKSEIDHPLVGSEGEQQMKGAAEESEESEDSEESEEISQKVEEQLKLKIQR